MSSKGTITIDFDRDDLAVFLADPRTYRLRVTLALDEGDLEHGELEREAIWSAEQLKTGLPAHLWALLSLIAGHDGPLSADEIAGWVEGWTGDDVRHSFRAIGRTKAYKDVKRIHGNDLPVRSYGEGTGKRYTMAPWWRSAIKQFGPE